MSEKEHPEKSSDQHRSTHNNEHGIAKERARNNWRDPVHITLACPE